MEQQKKRFTKEHFYSVGDVVNGLLITEQCYHLEKSGRKKKAYKYRCLTCGFDCGECYKKGVYYKEYMITESNLKSGAGCAICSKNGFIAPHINSIHALVPFVEKFLINKDDALKYAPNSTLKLKCKCINCGREYERSCAKLTYYGVPCICDDGFSYPEKFMFKALQQLKINFKPQYYLQDSLYRYDFYLIDYNIILEVNGIQHYKQKWERNEVENDANKKEFAFSCGFTEDNYIVLDCRESNLRFIKSSILNSKLNEIFCFNDVDFTLCAEFASSNLSKTASDLWNDGQTVKQISEELKLHKHTVIAYLKQGNENKWCVYNVGDGVKRYAENKKLKNIIDQKED